MRDVVWQLVVILLLIGGVLLLAEIPHYEGNALSHKERVAQFSSQLPSYEIQTFLKHITARLPHYREEFQQAGKETGIPWVLLASMSYQESKWNRRAISPTGVRGLMMLTRSTAADLGIENRLDPKNSITGGALYLAQLYKRFPHVLQSSDRMHLALASYNVGIGHVKDAQLLGRRLGKNPNEWEDLKDVLPLLAKKKFYQDLPHRYARGWEPVVYVTRIQEYRKILKQVIKTEAKTPPVEI
ncbi:MAG: transglycosylase SLT domain-containing protein [Nitrospirales bacterium]